MVVLFFDPQAGQVLGMASLADKDLSDFTVIPSNILLEAHPEVHTDQQKTKHFAIRRKRMQRWGLGIALPLLILVSLVILRLPLVKLLNQKGEQAYAEGRIMTAIKNFQMAALLNPKDASLPFKMAFVWANGGLDQASKVERYYKRAIELDPYYAEAKNNLARFYLSHSNEGFVADPLNNALRLLNQANKDVIDLEIEGIHDKILKNRAWANLQHGHLSNARADIEKSLSLNPEGAESHCLNALILEALDLDEATIKAWLSCLAYGEDDPSILYNKSHWLEMARERLREEGIDELEGLSDEDIP